MIDRLNELTQFSKYAGKLFLQDVAGDISGRREAENDANASAGKDRDMYCYAPFQAAHIRNSVRCLWYCVTKMTNLPLKDCSKI